MLGADLREFGSLLATSVRRHGLECVVLGAIHARLVFVVASDRDPVGSGAADTIRRRPEADLQGLLAGRAIQVDVGVGDALDAGAVGGQFGLGRRYRR